MLQSLVLRLYRSWLSDAVRRSTFGERIFQRAYFLYKGAYEAREARHLREFTSADAWIVDIGANIGFFTILFAAWLGRGKVLALEPEPNNFRRLEKIIAARGLGHRVEAREVAAGASKGTAHLFVSDESHADHRVGAEGIPIALNTLDNIWEELGRPDIRLVKIDVQGGERAALAGAKKVLATCRPALYVEVDTAEERGGTAHASGLVQLLEASGYIPFVWRSAWVPISPAEVISDAKRRRNGYADYLFRHG